MNRRIMKRFEFALRALPFDCKPRSLNKPEHETFLTFLLKF